MNAACASDVVLFILGLWGRLAIYWHQDCSRTMDTRLYARDPKCDRPNLLFDSSHSTPGLSLASLTEDKVFCGQAFDGLKQDVQTIAAAKIERRTYGLSGIACRCQRTKEVVEAVDTVDIDL